MIRLKIDYFCFSVPTLNSTDYMINEDDDENIVWIKNQEQKLINTAKANDMLIVFDRTTKKFYIDFQEINIRGYNIFPRSIIPYEEELLSQISASGAFSIQTNQDCDKIINWPQFIQPIHRKIITTTYKDFQENADIYKSLFNKLFIKTAQKSHIHHVLTFYGYIETEKKKIFYTKPPLFDISLDDIVFLSEKFEPIIDVDNNMNCKEYRIFVLNNKLLSISRSYIDYPTQVPNKVLLFVEEQINRISLISSFPSSYVLDIGEIKIGDKETLDIIELNPISSSGLEICNNLVEELLLMQNPSSRKLKKVD